MIKINQIREFCYLPDHKKNSCNLGRGWAGDDQLKKKLAASEIVKASTKGQEKVACGFLIKY